MNARDEPKRRASAGAEGAPIGIIAAVPEEVGQLARELGPAEGVGQAGFLFRRGRFAGRPVVLVEAGIGKVNAALVATLLADRFAVRAVVFSGVAGGLDPDLGIGDVVIARRLIQHDYGAIVEERLRPYHPGEMPMGARTGALGYAMPTELEHRLLRALVGVDLPVLSAAATGGARREPRLHFGTILTGDQFISSEDTRRRLAAEFSAQAVEMEGGAVAQVAERFAIPWVIVRSLSDLAGADSAMDFSAFVGAAAESAAQVLHRIIPAL
jgi:adenosylhomocysteine nucleosidase